MVYMAVSIAKLFVRVISEYKREARRIEGEQR